MIRLGNSGASHSDSPEALKALRAQFEQQHYVQFPGFLTAETLEFVQSQIDDAEFFERVHERIAANKELCMTGNAGFGALLLLVNDDKLFETVEAVTGCPRIRCFEGRVYRVSSGAGHHDAWHNDIGDHRLVGMSINLGREVYAGGALQIRERASGKVISEVHNVGAGAAVIFRLSEKLQHRITEVEGDISKSAFAGWFKSQPDFVTSIREQAERGRQAEVTKSPSPFSSEQTVSWS